jgi:DNA-binding MarR family transcriptional regulator
MSRTASPTIGMSSLLHAASSVESFVESKLSGVGLSIPKLAALNRLVEAGDSLPLGHLAERLACVKSNVTQLIDRLEAEGFVTRAPDPGDRRSRLAVITELGRTAYNEGARIKRAAEEQLFSVLSADDAARLGEIFEKLQRVHGSTKRSCI